MCAIIKKYFQKMENSPQKKENISKEYSLSKKNTSHFKWQNFAPKDMLIGTLKSTHHAT